VKLDLQSLLFIPKAAVVFEVRNRRRIRIAVIKSLHLIDSLAGRCI
jgi:hypothetical protein